ncbi:flavin-binding monooxygenase [Hortaea werneckii]|nr:flavin-binding monooxygenase [Hortaea werneckii]
MNASIVEDINASTNGVAVAHTLRNKPIHANRHMRVICVGAGASGLYLAYKLKHRFTDFTLNVYEKNQDISGTWYENRYPGCACDVPAHNYTYSFHPKHDWSANYASSKEIYTYFADFADTFGLREYISCGHEVVGAKWNEEAKDWTVKVKTADGRVFDQDCDFFINAAGILNNWCWPTISGIEKFRGPLLHSADWDDSVDLTGKRVGLIGNGSSGIQILPQVRQLDSHVTTFVRQPTWISPALGMEYHKYTDEEKNQFKNEPEVLLNMRKKTEDAMNTAFPLFINGSVSQAAAEQHFKQRMKSKLANPELEKLLIPDFTVGCRRLTPGVNYLESLGEENVSTVYGSISEITPTSCITKDGQEIPLDVLICATGFDTSFKPRFPVIGRGGIELAKEWVDEPRSYLSIAAHGYPNYFMFLGPNCPIGNGPIIFSIEIQGEYIAQLMNRWQKEDITSFDPKLEAVDDFMEHKDAFMPTTVWHSGGESWYKDPHSKKITALWPGSSPHYMEALAHVRYEDYDVTFLGNNRFAYLGNGFSQTELDPTMDKAYYIRGKDDGQPICRNLQSTYNAKTIGDLLTVSKNFTL